MSSQLMLKLLKTSNKAENTIKQSHMIHVIELNLLYCNLISNQLLIA